MWIIKKSWEENVTSPSLLEDKTVHTRTDSIDTHSHRDTGWNIVTQRHLVKRHREEHSEETQGGT